MITIRDYAKSRSISYEAARQQINRYIGRNVDGFELSAHITKVERTQYLDDEAVAFLDARRAKNPIIIQNEQRDETVERLRAEVDALQKRLIASQDEYRTLLLDKHAIEMREQALIADKSAIDSIKAAAEEAAARAEESEKARKKAEEEAKAAAEELQKAREEAERLRIEAEAEKEAAQAAASEQEKRARDAEDAAREATERADRAEQAAQEAEDKVERMNKAGLLARIFGTW